MPTATRQDKAILAGLGALALWLFWPRKAKAISQTPQELTLLTIADGDEIAIDNVVAGYAHWEALHDYVYLDYIHVWTNNSPTYQRDLLRMEQSADLGPINYVRVYNRWLSFHARDGWARTSLKTHGVVYDGDEFNFIHYQTYETQYDVNPFTGKKWTWKEVNALQAGVSLKLQAFGEMVWIVINYNPWL